MSSSEIEEEPPPLHSQNQDAAQAASSPATTATVLMDKETIQRLMSDAKRTVRRTEIPKTKLSHEKANGSS